MSKSVGLLEANTLVDNVKINAESPLKYPLIALIELIKVYLNWKIASFSAPADIGRTS